MTRSWVLPARRAPSMPGPMTFRFLNETRVIDEAPWDINVPYQLWRYNLHYFDDLTAIDAHARRLWHADAIARWIRDNPAGCGDAWSPFATSRRIVNWIKWALGGHGLPEEMSQSLAVQVRLLKKRLEYHLLGNHLFTNAKALVFAGLFFSGNEARGWLEKGMAILARETPEQILADGGQFERSTMYHALALEDVLDLVNMSTAFASAIPDKWKGFVASWPGLAQAMLEWLRAMCHPDGEIAFFNDAATGIAPPPAELERYASGLLSGLALRNSGCREVRRGDVAVRHLAQSGYLRADVPDAALILDIAPVGPDYLPGHAHADTLSFELSVFGHRVIVNRGTSRYGVGPERDVERGTPAHSTVTIDGQCSSEVWAGFRVARRARPRELSVTKGEDCLEVCCAHDGYRRLPGRPVHRRSWLYRPGMLRVEDRVEGDFGTAVARYHLHPSIELLFDESQCSGNLRIPCGKTVHWHASGGLARSEKSFYCPEFGRRDSTSCLTVEFRTGAPVCMELAW
jgi:uncharacterized heparinase superfamily protein